MVGKDTTAMLLMRFFGLKLGRDIVTSKKYGVWDKKNKKFVEWFEYPIQAHNFIKKRFGNSSNFGIIKKE